MRGFHYRISPIYPRRDVLMGGWGFNIELDFKFAVRMNKHPITPEQKARFNEIALSAHNYIDPEWRFRHPGCYSFNNDTWLLTSFRVDPGDCCCMGLDHGDVADVKRYTGPDKHQPDHVTFNPHNVDTGNQAMMLLSAFLLWYDTADACCQESAK